MGKGSCLCGVAKLVGHLIDTHCHLNHDGLREEMDAAVQRAQAAGVIHLVVVSYDLASSIEAVAIAEKLTPYASAVVGIHPTMAHTCTRECLHILNELAHNPLVVGIGETGLDLHYPFPPLRTQLEGLHAQLELAGRHNLPVVFHCRDAYGQLLTELRRCPPARGVMHCWAGNTDEAQQSVALGLHLGFGGVTTFKSAVDIQRAAVECPQHRIVLETDAPFLAPVPYRSKQNEPAYIAHTAAHIAKLRGVSPEELAHDCSRNAIELFPRLATTVQAALRA